MQECAPSLLLPADHVLTSGAVLFPGNYYSHYSASYTSFMYNSGLHCRQLRCGQEYEVLVEGDIHPKMKVPSLFTRPQTRLELHCKTALPHSPKHSNSDCNIYNINEVIKQTQKYG